MEKENLQFFVLRKNIEEVVNGSGLPLYARMIALKMASESLEKVYLEHVQKEYQDSQNERDAVAKEASPMEEVETTEIPTKKE